MSEQNWKAAGRGKNCIGFEHSVVIDLAKVLEAIAEACRRWPR